MYGSIRKQLRENTVEEFIYELDEDIEHLKEIQRSLNHLMIEREQIYGDIFQQVRRLRKHLRVEDIRKIVDEVFFDREPMRYPANALCAYANWYKQKIWQALAIPQSLWNSEDSDAEKTRRIRELHGQLNPAMIGLGIDNAEESWSGIYPLADCSSYLNDLPIHGNFVYLIYDREGEVIYVGRSGRVRSRLKKHGSGSIGEEASAWTSVRIRGGFTELSCEERRLIHRYQPKFNERGKDWNTWSGNEWLFQTDDSFSEMAKAPSDEV
jgi:hypothetical protein